MDFTLNWIKRICFLDLPSFYIPRQIIFDLLKRLFLPLSTVPVYFRHLNFLVLRPSHKNHKLYRYFDQPQTHIGNKFLNTVLKNGYSNQQIYEIIQLPHLAYWTINSNTLIKKDRYHHFNQHIFNIHPYLEVACPPYGHELANHNV